MSASRAKRVYYPIMRPVVLLVALVGCYPEFQFGDAGAGASSDDTSSSRAAGSTTDGMGATMSQGGAGNGGAPNPTSTGGNGGMGGSPTTTSTGTGGGPPFVTCGDGNGVLTDCSPNQSCCFSLEAQSMDHCEATTDCGANYYTLRCNAQADCGSTAICCAEFDDILETFLGVIQCDPTCAVPNRRMCKDVEECEPGEICTQLFADSFAPEYAPDYRFCDTP